METTFDMPMAFDVPVAKARAKRRWLIQFTPLRGFGMGARRVTYSRAVNYIAVVGNVELRAILFL